MLPTPRADLKPNTLEYENIPLVAPQGFREYDALGLTNSLRTRPKTDLSSALIGHGLRDSRRPRIIAMLCKFISEACDA